MRPALLRGFCLLWLLTGASAVAAVSPLLGRALRGLLPRAPAARGGRAPLRIGVLSTANINDEALLQPLRYNPGVGSITAIASRDVRKASQYALAHGLKGAKVFKSYQDLIDHADVDCIYNPLPNGLHYEWTMKALDAGKHVLCEKPFASNAKEARMMVDRAKQKGLVLMEAFHWYYHPFRQRLQDIMHSGILGDVHKISTQFTLNSGVATLGPQVMGWRFDHSLAGGTMMDLGTYSLDVMRTLMDHEVPTLQWAKAKRSPADPEIDMSMEAGVTFPKSGVTGTVSCSFLGPSFLNTSAVVEGSKGVMLGDGFCCGAGGRILVRDLGGRVLVDEAFSNLFGERTYSHQLRAFAELVQRVREGGVANDTANLGEAPVQQMQLLDQVYRLAGMAPRSSVSGIKA